MGKSEVENQMGKSAFVSGLFIVLFLGSGATGALGLAFRYVPILHSWMATAIPFFTASAICAVLACVLVLISEKL